MILTDLDHARQELAMTASFQSAVDFLHSSRWKHQPDGQIEIDGERVFALLQSYETLAMSFERLEAHRRHIDLHFIVSGEETIGWLPAVHMEPDEPYDTANDVWWGRATVSENRVTRIRLHSGQLAIFFPSDGHLPRQKFRISAAVKKVVIKVALEA